ncbi:hypothetical protein [Undibacterium squillarum]|uniref:ABC transporter substrate-binding protein n=1 Tax=Undibacterium squillarum TaxID=1131567 RepID=A0ABQ2Y074_9BURK|nr:hypothetical protein [Undibacterium squillarum]GGX42330.1 ABC transporter substrate-binding protein [Undibacterium squillarum]
MKMRDWLISGGLLATMLPSLAHAELVLIVNKDNPATKIYLTQVSQFYLGGSSLFAPVELADTSPLKAEFYKKVLDKEPSQVHAIWAKLTFTGKAKPPKEFKTPAEARKYVAETPNAIAYIDKASVDDSVKVVAVVP